MDGTHNQPPERKQLPPSVQDKLFYVTLFHFIVVLIIFLFQIPVFVVVLKTKLVSSMFVINVFYLINLVINSFFILDDLNVTILSYLRRVTTGS